MRPQAGCGQLCTIGEIVVFSVNCLVLCIVYAIIYVLKIFTSVGIVNGVVRTLGLALVPLRWVTVTVGKS